jgi:hypothetical protein
LKSEIIDNLTILLAAILKMVATQKLPWMQISSLPTNSSLQNTPRYKFPLKSETNDKMATIANQRLISIRNIIIYLDQSTLHIKSNLCFVYWVLLCFVYWVLLCFVFVFVFLKIL